MPHKAWHKDDPSIFLSLDINCFLILFLYSNSSLSKSSNTKSPFEV